MGGVRWRITYSFERAKLVNIRLTSPLTPSLTRSTGLTYSYYKSTVPGLPPCPASDSDIRDFRMEVGNAISRWAEELPDPQMDYKGDLTFAHATSIDLVQRVLQAAKREFPHLAWPSLDGA